MFTLIRSLPASELTLRQAPALATSLLTAELFYKFHSFTLEALAFLTTWFLLDAAVSVGRSAFVREQGKP